MLDADHEIAALTLADEAKALYGRGWMDGTAGNLSIRLAGAEDVVLITASGRSKDLLSTADTVSVRIATGEPTHGGQARPSAETSIHLALYRLFPDCHAVVHAHPPFCTLVASRAGDGHEVRFADYEFIKGLGVDPREADVPVFTNWPDVSRIAGEVMRHYAKTDPCIPPALLIAHHGATAWGPTLRTARNRLECLEALCQLAVLAQVYPHAEEATS